MAFLSLMHSDGIKNSCNFLAEGVKNKATALQVQPPLTYQFGGFKATWFCVGPSIKPTMWPMVWLKGLLNTFLLQTLKSTTI